MQVKSKLNTCTAVMTTLILSGVMVSCGGEEQMFDEGTGKAESAPRCPVGEYYVWNGCIAPASKVKVRVRTLDVTLENSFTEKPWDIPLEKNDLGEPDPTVFLEVVREGRLLTFESVGHAHDTTSIDDDLFEDYPLKGDIYLSDILNSETRVVVENVNFLMKDDEMGKCALAALRPYLSRGIIPAMDCVSEPPDGQDDQREIVVSHVKSLVLNITPM